MSLVSRGMSIMEMYRLYRNDQLIVNRKYQRKLVWTLEEKRMLVESILKAYPIPLILLAENPKETYEIIDGIQRLNSIFGFIENLFGVIQSNDEIYLNTKLFPLANTNAEKGIFTPKNGGTIKFLDSDTTSALLEYQIPITVYHAKNENEINEIFRRINAYGKHLSPQEVRQAGVTTKFTELVRELGAEFRGDVSKEILSLTEMPEISIDGKTMQLGYRINAEETFWCEQGILNISQLRNSEDEQLIADIILSIALNEPFPASKEAFDCYYGKGSPDNSNEIEIAINKYGADNLKNEIKIVYSKIKDMVETYATGEKLKMILNPKAGGNPVKEPFYTFFMATHNLMFKEGKEPFIIGEIFKALNNLAAKNKRGSHSVRSEDRKNNIATCKGLIQDYFKVAKNIARSSGTLALDFENYLWRSKVEAPMYDYKQGLYSLDTKDRKINEEMFEKIYQNIAAFANLGKGKKGYLFIGVTDKEADTVKIEQIDKISKVPRVGTFGVVGLEREAKLKGVTLDQYISSITQKIRESKLPDWLKLKVNTSITPITYKGFTLLMIEVVAGNEPVWYKDNLYIRDGASCKELKGGSEISSVFGLFN